jgi:hypothetical protein
MSLEQDLERALTRKPAPPDLADRILARVASATDGGDGTPPAPARTGGRDVLMRWLAAAAAVTLLATGSARYYEHRRAAAQAERVQQELRLALQITSEKLSLVQQRLDSSLTRDGSAAAGKDR